MSFGKLIVIYGATAAAFLAIDIVWLSTMTSRFYQPRLGELLSPKPNMAVAGLFYLVYVIGLVALAVVPALREGALMGALWRGALFGFIAYATYDLTNLATLRDWPWDLTVVDIVWGTSLNTVASAAGYLAGRWVA